MIQPGNLICNSSSLLYQDSLGRLEGHLDARLQLHVSHDGMATLSVLQLYSDLQPFQSLQNHTFIQLPISDQARINQKANSGRVAGESVG